LHRRIRQVWGVLGIVLLVATAAGAQRSDDSRTVVALGFAAVQGGNVAAARDAAVGAGLMQAVTLVAIDLLSPEVFSEHFRKLNDTLLDRPDAFVQDFRVLSEAAVGKQHRVLVQVTVAVKPVQDVMARLATTPARPAAVAAPLVLTVEGTSNLSNAVKFRKAIGSTPGVESIQVKEMKPNATILWITYRGSPEEMVRSLAAQSFDTFALDVLDEDPASLKVALVPK
jgi:hypothetical protein